MTYPIVYKSKKTGQIFSLEDKEGKPFINLEKEIFPNLKHYKLTGTNNMFEVFELKKSKN